MARKRKKQTNPLDEFLDLLALVLKPEVVGLTLILVSVFTLLSLFSSSRGSLTGFWINLLRDWTGVGVWGVPLLTGVLGMWMVIRAIEKMPDLPWQRPLGMFLLFVAFVTAVTLAVPVGIRATLADADGPGGRLGLLLASGLESGLGGWGAWSVVTFLGFMGLILLTDRLLLDLLLDSWDIVFDLWDDWQERRQTADEIAPTLPLPSGDLPWWKRLLPRRRQEPEIPINGGRHAPGATQQPTPRQAPASRSKAPAPASSALQRQPVSQPSDESALSPRIVGGVQKWTLPRIEDMLDNWDRMIDSYEKIRERGKLIEKTLELFGVPARFKEVNIGPTVTQYLIEPGYNERTVRGETRKIKVKVSKIASLSNDLALALAAPSVRIEAPVPGTNYVGIEVPNQDSNVVGLRELMESEEYQTLLHKGRLGIALGEDVKGKPVVTDLGRMPHLLIAGATGSGKSVCINSIITCLLLTHTPDSLRLLMVDPKMVELTVYNGAPHLLSPVVTDVERAAGVLFWAVKEMERRYQLLNKANARDLVRYNEYLEKKGEEKLPFIVVVIDEMADLMMAAPEEVEKYVCRLAQMARAVGIHLIIATQRPSVDVITGLIKANFPARIAFAVTSQTDSRVILDVPGADRLLGRGDMLFMAPDASKLERLQGTFLSDEEINRIVRYWKGIRSLEHYAPPPLPDVTEAAETDFLPDGDGDPAENPFPRHKEDTDLVQPLFEQIEVMKTVEGRDELFDDAVRAVQDAGRGSTTLLQRKLRIGYNRASRLVDQLEQAGIVGPDQGGNLGREVYLDSDPSAEDDAPLNPRIIGDDDTPRIWF